MSTWGRWETSCGHQTNDEHDCTKGRAMTPTSVRAGRRAGQTHAGNTRTADSSALRAASRQLLATAGNQVLRAAVDRAVGRVDQAADRLDAVAAGGGRALPATPRRKPAERPDHDGQRAGRPVQVKMGAAFSLVVHQAARILQLIQRLVQQLVTALARLVRRDTADTRGEREPGAAASAPRSPQAPPRSRPRPATKPSSRRRRAAPGAVDKDRQG
jgi:hypothetical protein